MQASKDRRRLNIIVGINEGAAILSVRKLLKELDAFIAEDVPVEDVVEGSHDDDLAEVGHVGLWQGLMRYYSWIGYPVQGCKNQFNNKPRGLRRIQDHHWKALGKTHLNEGGGRYFL